ncbi:hypothetical protein OB236_17855 [Paenibacillus sp. WQ 127069]|uniref:Uncharacterized protein n=1 Tax=Paenibacillus baimaensis TaxID=2982185 RepID=A0ABT2UIL4_9BACL|nr:hypothetical protein [Paenibacillus sp. WQ 127069]MCU6793971.1 hypothetical protein [Paenibacillus sp. WQ 127069]
MTEEQLIQEVETESSTVLSFLLARSKDFDTVLLKARDQFPGPPGWLGPLLIRSLLGLQYEKMPDESMQKGVAFFSNHITVWIALGAGALGITSAALNWHTLLDSRWPSVIGVSWFLLSIFLSIKANFTRMLTLDDPYFTPVMYKLFRPKEYYLILNYLKSSHSFEWAYDMVKNIFRDNSFKSISEHYEKEIEKLRNQNDNLIQNLAERAQFLKEAELEIDKLDQQIDLLIQQVTTNEDGFNTAIDTLYRLRRRDPSLFGINDLRILSNFSLFELIGDDLYMIGEQGTTETPSHIDIHDPEYAHYSSIRLISSEKSLEYATSDREGRTVASYWIELPSERVLIYNFHYDSTNLQLRDTIESKEMYRLIRIICILLDERGLLNNEEGVQNAEA